LALGPGNSANGTGFDIRLTKISSPVETAGSNEPLFMAHTAA
jgi:hypothetical protein